MNEKPLQVTSTILRDERHVRDVGNTREKLKLFRTGNKGFSPETGVAVMLTF